MSGVSMILNKQYLAEKSQGDYSHSLWGSYSWLAVSANREIKYWSILLLLKLSAFIENVDLSMCFKASIGNRCGYIVFAFMYYWLVICMFVIGGTKNSLHRCIYHELILFSKLYNTVMTPEQPWTHPNCWDELFYLFGWFLSKHSSKLLISAIQHSSECPVFFFWVSIKSIWIIIIFQSMITIHAPLSEFLLLPLSEPKTLKQPYLFSFLQKQQQQRRKNSPWINNTGDRGASQSWSRSLNDSHFSKVSHALFPSLLCASYDMRKPQVRHVILSSLLTSSSINSESQEVTEVGISPHYFGGNSTSYWGGVYFPLLSNFFWMI